MIQWNQYENLSPEFLEKHHDLVLYDVFHHVKAFLLFPTNCACKDSCRCAQLREEVVRSLNTPLFNRVLKGEEDIEIIYGMKSLLKIPEDSAFRKHHEQAYPLWLTQEKLKEKSEEKSFKNMNQLVWALLRLSYTNYKCYSVFEASLNKAIKMIIGDIPLKTKAVTTQGNEEFYGEKAFGEDFHKCKTILHFIAALEWIKKEDKQNKNFLFDLIQPTDKIERFLRLSQWFGKRIFSIETPNIKEKNLFLDGGPLSLPSWIKDDEINLPIEIVEERVEEIRREMRGPFQSTKEAKEDKLARLQAAADAQKQSKH